jgi:hypothetical protein
MAPLYPQSMGSMERTGVGEKLRASRPSSVTSCTICVQHSTTSHDNSCWRATLSRTMPPSVLTKPLLGSLTRDV